MPQIRPMLIKFRVRSFKFSSFEGTHEEDSELQVLSTFDGTEFFKAI